MDEQNMSQEQAADLAALESMAGDQASEPQNSAVQVVHTVALEVEISGLLKMLAAVIRPALPSVADIYTESTCDSIGGVVAPVCRKHGWLQGGVGGKWGDELLCLAVVGPIAWATVEAARADLAALRARKRNSEPVDFTEQQSEGSAMQTPGADRVIVGAPIPDGDE